jgi:rsbT antagonist protein RsbS
MDDGYHRIPIIKLWHLLLVPLQGELTDDLADQLTSEVLERIYRDGSSGLVIDITALWMVDSHLCSVLSQLASATALMGARTIISGMKPEIALTLETMGVQLGAVTTTLSLEDGLALLGARISDTSARGHAPTPAAPPPPSDAAADATTSPLSNDAQMGNHR